MTGLALIVVGIAIAVGIAAALLGDRAARRIQPGPPHEQKPDDVLYTPQYSAEDEAILRRDLCWAHGPAGMRCDRVPHADHRHEQAGAGWYPSGNLS